MKKLSLYLQTGLFLSLCSLVIFAGGTPISTQAESCNNFDAAEYNTVGKGLNPSYTPDQTINTTLSLITKSTSSNKGSVDIVLVMDRSGSMGTPALKITNAKKALNAVVDSIAASGDSGTRIALVTYSSSATLDQAFTTNYNAVKVAINSMVPAGTTSIGGGLIAAAGALNSVPKIPNQKRYIILASDGLQNTNPALGVGISSIPLDVTAYTVGIGSDADPVALKSIALSSGAKNGQYFASSIDELVANFKQIIAEIMGFFTLDNISVTFTRDDISHSEFIKSTPNFSAYEPVNGNILWNNIGSMNNARTSLIKIDFLAKSVGSNIPMNTDTLKVKYTIKGLACTDIVPINKLQILIMDEFVPACEDLRWEWVNPAETKCTTLKYPQVSNCGNTREISGSVVCPQCGDGVDNDGDGKIDYPIDPGCQNKKDNSEYGIPFYSEF